MTQYRIDWVMVKNNYTSHGEWFDSREHVIESIDSLNIKYKGEIIHTIGIR